MSVFGKGVYCKIEKFLGHLKRFIEQSCTILFLLMTLITFTQVVGRYALGKCFFWAEELARFSMIWIAFLGAAAAVSEKAHTRIDFFLNLLPLRTRKFIEIFNIMMCLLFMVIISWHSMSIVKISMRNISTGLPVPLSIIFVALPISGLLMVLYFIIQIYQLVYNDKEVKTYD